MGKQKRAKVGGEVGMNGEWYNGGEFLPNTELHSRHNEKVKGNGGKKEQYEPYKWDYAPDGMRSIYTAIAGIYGKIIDGKMVITVKADDGVFAYYGRNLFMVNVLAAKYNQGIRWLPANEVWPSK